MKRGGEGWGKQLIMSITQYYILLYYIFGQKRNDDIYCTYRSNKQIHFLVNTKHSTEVNQYTEYGFGRIF
jgi:hypothetical protein